MAQVRTAFQQQEVMLPIHSIVFQKDITPAMRRTPSYRRIVASLEHVGLIEPIVVFPRAPNDYLLLDGHLRVDIMKSTGAVEVRAIFALDDESYNYNHRVNFVSPVGQHFMILKALENGLSEERIARALNVDVARIRKKRNMLDGICAEAVEILRNKNVNEAAFAVLRKMKPTRQIESAEHMIATGNYSLKFAKALLAVTRPELLCKQPASKGTEAGSKTAQILLEQETESLIKDLKSVQESYGTDRLALTVILGYIDRLLANAKVEKFLIRYHPDLLNTMRSQLAEGKAKISQDAT